MLSNWYIKFAAIVALIMIAHSAARAQPWEGWPYRPEYAFGWGYLPLLGFGYNWRYPNVVEVPAYVVTAEDIAYCARRFRTYDPVSQTYLGRDGYRYPCP